MRVLITTDTVGGVWTFAQELASGLLAQSCDVALISLGTPPNKHHRAWCSDMQEHWSGRFCFRNTPASLEWMQQNDRAFTGASAVLRRLAEEFAPDVFHTNQFCFAALPVSMPRIVTAHSDVLSWAASCRQAPLEDSPWLRQYHSLVRTGLDGADAVVAPTHWMLNALGRNFQLPPKQLVIPNGRSIDIRPRHEPRVQAVTAGRIWDEAKNIALLSGLHTPMPLLIAGELARGQTTAPAIQGAAEFLGALSQKALLALFRESAIYICTSRYEPFGLAPLEAALCGCAVLANDIPSLREVWGDGALYFDDPRTLSQLLHALYVDRDLLLAAQALSFKAARRYTRDAMASGYLSLYKELAAGRRELCDVA